MCRFLLAKSQAPLDPGPILHAFADMSEAGKAPDGDWQGDGWGMAYLSCSDPGEEWHHFRSVSPIWKDRDKFDGLPEVSKILVHARSASFPQHKNRLEFNQPFINEKYAYVFNGLIKGVSTPKPVAGRIGSQKIWTILQNYLNNYSPKESITRIKTMLSQNSREILAFNIGLCDRQSFYALCSYSQYPGYYTLHMFRSSGLNVLSSEPIRGYDFEPVAKDRVLIF